MNLPTVTKSTPYYPYKAGPSDGDCWVCQGSLNNDPVKNPVVAHTWVNLKTPGIILKNQCSVHEKCARLWFRRLKDKNCPLCTSPIDCDLIFTWQDRCIIELNLMVSDALTGICSFVGSHLLDIGGKRVTQKIGEVFEIKEWALISTLVIGIGIVIVVTKARDRNKGMEMVKTVCAASGGALVGLTTMQFIQATNRVTIFGAGGAALAIGGAIGGVIGRKLDP